MEIKEESTSAGTMATALFLIIALVIVGLWDLYAGWWTPPQSSVSAVIQEWSRRYPALPLAIGILLGHLFWPTYR